MKKRNFGLFIFILLFPLFFSINVSGVSNVNYNFRQNTLLSLDTPSFDQEFNLRDVSVFQGHYNETEGFNDEIIGTQDENITFITDKGDYLSEIIESRNDHRNVLQMTRFFDNIAPTNTFLSSQASGSIEFWMDSDSTGSDLSQINLFDNAIRLIIVGFERANNIVSFFHGNGVGGFTEVRITVGLVWQHISLDFDMSTDKYTARLNNTIVINNENFFNDNTGTSATHITFGGNQQVSSFYDSFGYTWKNYDISDNLLPFLESTPLRKEVDKAEFALKDANTFTESTDTKYDGFDVVEVSDGLVFSLPDTTDSNDRILSFTVQDGGDVAQIVKDNIGNTGSTFIHASVEATVQDFAGVGGTFQTIIRSLDDTNIGGFKFDMTLFPTFEIAVWVSGWSTVAESLNFHNNMLIDHYIDYELDIQIIDITINGTFQNRTIKPIAVFGKSGFNKIEVDLSASPFAGSVHLDSLGVYAQANPITEGLGFGVVNIGSTWIVENFNLFTKQINGLVHIGSTEGFYQVDDFPNTFSTVEPFQQFNNISQFENVYFSGVSTTTNFSFVFTVNGSQFSISELLIQGVSLNQQNNVYNLRFRIGNISVNDNFFTVSNSQLQFTHTSVNDSQLQFIEASFDINNFLSEQKGISFKSQIDNRAFGNFTIEFTSGVQQIPLSVLSKTQNVELNTSKTVNQFKVLVTDNNNNNITGITTGFIGKIIIFPNTDLLPNFLIFSLLGMLIPLIIILIPTVALRELYGTSLVIPIFLLMSFILLFGGILPIWLIFIIIISSSLFILKKNKTTID